MGRDTLTTTDFTDIYLRERDGTLHVRHQWTDPATLNRKGTTWMVPRAEGLSERQYMLAARAELLRLRDSIESTARVGSDPHQRFEDYVERQIAQRFAAGVIGESTRFRYDNEMKKWLIPKWGKRYLDNVSREEVKEWMGELGQLAVKRKYQPSYLNGVWRTFKTFVADYAVDYRVPNPCERIHSISTALGKKTYTLKEPNSLGTGEELVAFFKACKDVAPQCYGFFFLGVLTGRRTCELKPLRAAGKDPDVDWETGVLQVRRSQVRDFAPREMTKQKKDVFAVLPKSMLDILAWHRGEFGLRAPRGEELLFPPRFRHQGYMSPAALDKVLPLICEKAGIKKHITPRFMRRTYNDIGDEAKIDREVIKAMSGHGTDKMKEHYSTVALRRSKEALTSMLAFTGLAA